MAGPSLSLPPIPQLPVVPQPVPLPANGMAPTLDMASAMQQQAAQPGPGASMADQYAWREALAAQRTGRTDLGSPQLSAPPIPGGPPTSAPQLPAPDFYAIANAQGQNSPAQAAPPPMVSPPASAPQIAPASSATPSSNAPPQLPPVAPPAMLPEPPIPLNHVTPPQIPQGAGALFNIPQPPAPSTAPAIPASMTMGAPITAAAPTFHAASARPAMPQFSSSALSPIRPYSAAPVMPGYAQARTGQSFMGASASTAPPIPQLTGPGGLTAGIGGDTSVPFAGGSFNLGGDGGLGMGSLFNAPQPNIQQQQADPSLYGDFLMPRNFQ